MQTKLEDLNFPSVISPDPIVENLFSKNLEKQLFNTFSSVSRSSHAGLERDYHCYPISHLAVLIEKLKASSHTTKEIRYVLDADFNLWFALEGFPCKTIPAHYEMISNVRRDAKCISAGNIRFSTTCDSCVMINHKSGCFRPSFDSMKWVLAILFSQEQNLPAGFFPAKLELQQLNEKSGLLKSHVFMKDQLKKTLEFSVMTDELVTHPQPEMIKSYTSQPVPQKNDSLADDQSKEQWLYKKSNSYVLNSNDNFFPALTRNAVSRKIVFELDEESEAQATASSKRICLGE